MAPKLYMMELSCPVRAVLMCEKALGIQLEYVEVDLLNEGYLKPEFVKINPQHTVPTLVDDDGTTIWDSHAIMAYLVGKYGKDDSLYPKDLAKRAIIDQRMHFDSGSVFPIMRNTVWALNDKKIDKITDENAALLNKGYEFLNFFLQDSLWVAGNDITIADFSLITTVTAVQHFLPVDPEYENVHAWLKRAEELPYYEINAKGLAQLKGVFEKLINEAIV